jgi:hypothetical protein
VEDRGVYTLYFYILLYFGSIGIPIAYDGVGFWSERYMSGNRQKATTAQMGCRHNIGGYSVLFSRQKAGDEGRGSHHPLNGKGSYANIEMIPRLDIHDTAA